MGRSKTPTHIAEFPLKARRDDVRRVGVRFDFERQIYNAVLGTGFKRLARVRADNTYQDALDQLRKAKKAGDERAIKRLRTQLGKIEAAYGYTEYALHSVATRCKNSCQFKDHLDGDTIQKMATRAWKALRDYQLRQRGKPRFKSWRRGIDSVEGKSKACLSIRPADKKKPLRVAWKGLEFPIKLSRHDRQGYEARALAKIESGEWKFLRLLRREIRGEMRLFVQVILTGTPFVKEKNARLQQEARGKRVGYDIGPSTIAVVSEAGALLTQLCPGVMNYRRDIRVLQRQNSRRLRLANPDNFTARKKRRGRKTVTVYKAKKGARQWDKSQAYLETRARIRDLHRAMAAQRKQAHDSLANEILSHGLDVCGETLSYKAWQKLFGRSIRDRAPAALVTTLRRKAAQAGGVPVDINACTAKLSQYDHTNGVYTKKGLSVRAHALSDSTFVQRDLYAAFLALSIDTQGVQVDDAQAERLWPSARQALDKAVHRVAQSAKGSAALPASLGIREILRHGRSTSSLKSRVPGNRFAATAA